MCYIVQRRNGFSRKKKKDDAIDDETDDAPNDSAHHKKPQWFTQGLVGDLMKNQIYFEGKNFEAIYVKPGYEACKTFA